MPRTLRSLALFASVIIAGSSAANLWAATPSATGLTFEQHVRPLVKVHCLHCHGDGDEKEGGLDLRLRRLMVSGGDSGPAIKPGNAGASLLVEKLRAGEMPPGDKKMSAAEIALVERWVAEGAKTARVEPATLTADNDFTDEERGFWSFQPIRRPAVPGVAAKARVRTPIDNFILDKLEDRGLTLSADADKRTLVRRAYYDLLGLPPSPGEVDAFLADKRPDAYERLIDDLLSRPQYGERWGRHWLDVAGYADSDGYTPQDPERPYAYKYRDYVVRSFNADRPFDEFIRAQLAGDELLKNQLKNLAGDDLDKLIATGFLRMAPDGTGVGGVDPSVARNHVVADTLKIVSTSLMGLTLGCAECHSHKYDPIPQADYYRFRAIFEPALDWKNWRSPGGRLVSLATDADRKLTAELEAQAAAVDAERVKLQQKFIESTFEEQLAKLPAALHEPLRKAFHTPDAKRTPQQKRLIKENPSVNVSAGSLYLYDRPREAAARVADAKLLKQRALLMAPILAKLLPKVPAAEQAALKQACYSRLDARTDDQKTLLAKYPGFNPTADELAKLNPAGAKELAQLEAESRRLHALVATEQVKKLIDKSAAIRANKPKPDFVQALTEVPGKVPTTHLFYRGDFSQPRQPLEPGELTVLASWRPTKIEPKDKTLPTTGRRLALAEHLTDGQHPLVSRVLVNRLWLHHFGRGIVGTPGDFGVLGERPTHPELLDWLASEFTTGGWKLKRMHKLIMTSSVYRQSSRRSAKQDAVDPDNRLLARMNVRRAEAEAIRDSILAVSGKLNPKAFGPSVPVTPDEVGQIVIGKDTRDSAGRPTKDQGSVGDEAYRRSVYVQVRRSMPLGMLETFDAPTMTSNCNCEVRSNSTVAPQSLILMNSEFLLEQAGFCAQRLRESSSDLAEQAKLAWKLALARPPEPRELAEAMTFLQGQIAAFKSAAKAKPAVEPETRALTNLCQALMSSNEFLYID